MSDDSEEIDFSKIPRLLFSQFDMKIVNHDGGAKVMLFFPTIVLLQFLSIAVHRTFKLHFENTHFIRMNFTRNRP